jgi:hypothetical protein
MLGLQKTKSGLKISIAINIPWKKSNFVQKNGILFVKQPSGDHTENWGMDHLNGIQKIDGGLRTFKNRTLQK